MLPYCLKIIRKISILKTVNNHNIYLFVQILFNFLFVSTAYNHYRINIERETKNRKQENNLHHTNNTMNNTNIIQLKLCKSI